MESRYGVAPRDCAEAYIRPRFNQEACRKHQPSKHLWLVVSGHQRSLQTICLSNTAIHQRISSGEFPSPSKVGKRRVWQVSPALPSLGFRKCCAMHEWQECESCTAALVDGSKGWSGPFMLVGGEIVWQDRCDAANGSKEPKAAISNPRTGFVNPSLNLYYPVVRVRNRVKGDHGGTFF